MKSFQFKKVAIITVITFLVFTVSIFYYYAYNEIQFQTIAEINRRNALEKDLTALLSELQKYNFSPGLKVNSSSHSLKKLIRQAREARSRVKQKIYDSYFDPENFFFRSASKLFPVPGKPVSILDSLYTQEKNYLKQSAVILSELESLRLKSEDAARNNNYHALVDYSKRINQALKQLQTLSLQWMIDLKEMEKNLSLIQQSLYHNNLLVLLLIFLLDAAILGLTIFLLISIFNGPLLKLNEMATRINSGNYSLKKFHIPNFKEPVFSNISMAFRSLLQHIEEVDRVKGSIMSQVTHDLKSPLATMKKSIDLLENESYGKLTAEQQKVVDILRKGYEQMNHLVQNLLNAARMEYDVLSLKLERFDLLQATMEVFEEHRVPLLEKNIRIKYNFHQRQKLGMIGDVERIKDVIRNLLGNAIKFTPENGKIYVEIDLRDGDVYIRIQDTGIGIPARELDKIFEKMYRASNSRSISVKGTGMGLFIVKNIVTMHKGEIFVKSQEGLGTTFEIYLPRILRKPGE